ncbi:hypothetical protein H261_00997 [Paramagnetospirillum caucaseum]|uniref:Uncharacterized protein n=2 Tax=Paramagnetospirillum caucaseum TaxID=1244869 RepID=M2ZWI6_9PROT|nr:hypothetical protein H261_00997 [Paramagnetospirillum caucaseum]
MQATGAESGLDGDLAAAFGVAPAPFTASVPDCRALVETVVPGMRLHLGYGANGMFPYALLSGEGLHIVSEAPTVPLAILRSLVAARTAQERSAPPAA